jgi:anti-anti-sigma factor
MFGISVRRGSQLRERPTLRETGEVPPEEHLDPDPLLCQRLPDLAPLAAREALPHHRAFDVDPEIGEAEVGRERLAHGAVRIALEHERVFTKREHLAFPTPYAAVPEETALTSYELAQRPTDDPSLVLVDVTGELDLTNAHELEERLEALGESNGARLVLDLNRVVFVDSAALHVLFRIARRLGKDRFGLVLEPSAAVARTLAIVGISEVATISETLDSLESS